MVGRLFADRYAMIDLCLPSNIASAGLTDSGSTPPLRIEFHVQFVGLPARQYARITRTHAEGRGGGVPATSKNLEGQVNSELAFDS